MLSATCKAAIRRFTLHLSLKTLLLVALGISVGGAFYLLTRRIEIAVLIGILSTGLGSYLWFRHTLEPRLHALFAELQALRVLSEKTGAQEEGLEGDVFQVLESGLRKSRERLWGELKRLKQMENYRREFLGDVSHELKTPIFAIQGFVETLLDGALEDEEVNRDFLRRIQCHTERLNALVGDLLQISRLETGELTMQHRPFDIAKVIAGVCETLAAIAREKAIHLRQDVPPDLPLVVGDAERIRQVLINLVDNAIKYNHPGGYVVVRAYPYLAQRVLIEVEDTGIGIPQDALSRVTERFFRVDKSRSRAQGGTGLGLSIVKHILAAHKTQLVIRSEEQKGSVFSFSLPLYASVTPSL